MTELKILLVTDTHSYEKNLELLTNELKGKKYDLVFHTGDFDSLNKEDWTNFKSLTKEEQLKSDAKIFTCLKYLKKFSKDEKVYFVTGNHDSPNFLNKVEIYYENKQEKKQQYKEKFNNNVKKYNENDEIVESGDHYAINLNFSIHEVAENLELIGLGGSVPTKYKNNPFMQIKDKDKIIYEGIPYENEFFYEEDYLDDLRNLIGARINPEKQFILLTHNGPEGITSNHYDTKYDHFFLDMGVTSYLNEIRYNYLNSIVFCCHGHTHKSQGRIGLDSTIVINAGSLLNKLYTEVIIVKEEGKWNVKETSFKKF